ncbi:hypothetical protein Trydic_g7645 [Trypoxylus dichotomus]
MPLLPYLLNDLDALNLGSSRPINQHYSCTLGPEELLVPFSMSPSPFVRIPSGYVRPWRSNLQEKDTGSTVKIDKNKYQVNLDVQQFQPEEITVKVTGKNIITVEGKHEEKEDNHGFISRHFVRKYLVPEGHNLDEVVSTLSSDGILTITVPKAAKEDDGERVVNITQTGVPVKNPVKTTEDKQQ